MLSQALPPFASSPRLSELPASATHDSSGFLWTALEANRALALVGYCLFVCLFIIRLLLTSPDWQGLGDTK